MSLIDGMIMIWISSLLPIALSFFLQAVDIHLFKSIPKIVLFFWPIAFVPWYILKLLRNNQTGGTPHGSTI